MESSSHFSAMAQPAALQRLGSLNEFPMVLVSGLSMSITATPFVAATFDVEYTLSTIVRKGCCRCGWNTRSRRIFKLAVFTLSQL